MKDALTEWRDKLQTKGKYLQITHNKGFMSRIYKELSNPTIENTQKKKKKGKIFEQKLYQRRYRMTNKHMKRCLFNIIIKITRCPCTPITMTKSTHLTTPSVSEGAEHLELPCVAGGNARRSRASQFCFFNKVKCIFTRWPAVLLLDIFPREMKTYIHIQTCMYVFIAALIIITKNFGNCSDVLQ